MSSSQDDAWTGEKHEAMAPPLMLLIAAPNGFCAGVRRAINAVEDALDHYEAPVYVRRPIVHNMAVVRALEAKGAIFVEELDDVPENAVVIMSAHGIAPRIAQEANRRSLTWIDAVCPLVAKVHREVTRHHRDGRHMIVIGHDGHPEIEGTLGHLPEDAASLVASADDVYRLTLPADLPIAYAIQTTFAVEDAENIVEAILARFTNVRGPASNDICYATTNRQAAVRAIAGRADAMIVAGEHFSSNAQRLADVARSAGCTSVQLVSDSASVDWSLLEKARTVGLTAAASTPDETVDEIVSSLGRRFRLSVEDVVHSVESTVFSPVRIN